MTCSGFAGSPGANAIRANGGGNSGAYSAGGGGRIAMISTGGSGNWSGSFAWPTDVTTASSLKNVIKATGGSGTSTAPNGGAGTIYLKHSGLSYGALMVDNNNIIKYLNGGTTVLPSLAGTVTSAPSGTNLPVTVVTSPSLSASYTDVYIGMRLRPNVAYTNGTPADWTDDNILTVASNNGTSLTTTAAISGVNSGDTFRTVEFLDEMYLGGGAVLESNGDVYLTNSGWLTVMGGVPSLPSASSFGGILASMPFVFGGSNIMEVAGAVSLPNFTMNAGAATLSINNLDVVGDVTIAAGILSHNATTATVLNRMNLTIGGNLVMNGGSLSAEAKGYTQGYSYGPSGPSTGIGSTVWSGGSHGGRGGAGGGTPGSTYDNFRDPMLPGGGGAGSNAFVGGGVIAVTATGTCTINSGAIISASSGTSSAAGGSVNLKCLGFGGTAGASAIRANGGNNSGAYGAGGGGRIAMISSGDASNWTGSFTWPSGATNLANFKSAVKASGGSGSGGAGNGGAGTIFVKNSASTYGSLIIDNNNVTVLANGGNTDFLSSTANGNVVFANVSNNQLQITNGATPFNNQVDMYQGQLVSVWPLASPDQPSDGSHVDYTVSSNTNNILTVTPTSVPTISSDYKFRFLQMLDYLDVGGRAIVDLKGSDLYLGNCDLHSAASDTFDVPANSSITGNSFESPLCRDPLVTTKGSTVNFTNYYLQP